ncbi:MAG: ABC transporter ATP-binding protein [Candidatus Methylomirabilia bacterium]
MIQVQHLTKQYGPVTAIQDVSFSVDKGEVVGFLGPNGAGKTTTMRILACFMPATGGTATVAGYDVFTQSLQVRKRMGYLPEHVPLYHDIPVAAYLDFVAELKGVGRAERKRRVAAVIERCHISKEQHRLIGRLSKGYRQRVGLAQALVNDPEVLILDEPTIGLDPKEIIEIRSLIKSLAGQHTVILSTHILPEASMVCSRVVIINQGQIVAVDSPENLTARLAQSDRIQVQVDGPDEAVLAVLRQLPGVLSVDEKGLVNGIGTYVVESARDRDLRRDLSRAIADRGWGLLELRAIGMTLEDIFIRLVTEEEPVAVSRAEAGAEGGEAAP